MSLSLFFDLTITVKLVLILGRLMTINRRKRGIVLMSCSHNKTVFIPCQSLIMIGGFFKVVKRKHRSKKGKIKDQKKAVGGPIFPVVILFFVCSVLR